MHHLIRRGLRRLVEHFYVTEIIGQEECPMMLRWTILNLGFAKLLVHYFPPEVSDRDPHDHPRPFGTLVLRGNYRDVSWRERSEVTEMEACDRIVPTGIEHTERLCVGAVRYRPAEYMHIVETDEVGCWTIVVMGPMVREWGFMRLSSGLWWPWGKYIQKFGGVVRCDAPPDKMGVEVQAPKRTAADYKTQVPL